MNRFIVSILFLLSIILNSCSDQSNNPTTGKITGQISDFKTNIGVPFAQIYTNPPSASVIADSLGKFVISDVDAGNYEVFATKYGYKEGSIKINVNANKTTITNIRLVPLDSSELTNPTNEDGLIAYYKFDGNATDLTANKLDGAEFYTTYTSDRNGNAKCAIKFLPQSSNVSYVRVNDNHKLDFSDEFTICFWINPEFNSGHSDGYNNIDIISKWQDYGLNNSSYGIFLSNNRRIHLSLYNGLSSIITNVFETTSSLNTNQWSHVAVIFAKNMEVKIYINGVLETSGYSTEKPQYSNYQLSIGTRTNNATALYAALDEVRFYNYALNLNQINNLMK